MQVKSKGKELYTAVARHLSSLGMKSSDIFGLAIQIGMFFFFFFFFFFSVSFFCFFQVLPGKPILTQSNPLEPILTQPNPFQPIPTQSNLAKPNQTQSKLTLTYFNPF